MNILAIDTSSSVGSAAVIAHGEVLAESSARVRATHSEEILAMVSEVLARGGLRPVDIQLVAVGIGPGSFTGVRIGMATAKGLHIALDVPLVGVTSLNAMAASAWGAEGYVLTALDARRDELYAAGWIVTKGVRTPRIVPFHGSPEVVGETILRSQDPGRVLVVTDVTDAAWVRLTRASPDRFVRAPRVVGSPLARYIAWEAAAGRGVLDTGSLEPEYLRSHDAKLPGRALP